MSSDAVAVLSGLLSGAAGSAVAGYLALRKVRSDLAAEYDKDVRGRRLEQYLTLWPRFASFATTQPSAVTREDVQALSDMLRAWYFDEGGIYLSRHSLDAYNLLQSEIRRILAKPALEDDDRAVVRFLASRLRLRPRRWLQPLAHTAAYEGWQRRRLYRRVQKSLPAGGYAGPELEPSSGSEHASAAR